MSETNNAFSRKSSASSTIVSFRQATTNDRTFLLTLRKASMNEHLINAGIYLDDVGHMQRIDEYFSDSQIILYQDMPIGLIKLGQFPGTIHIRQFQLMPQYHGLGIGSRVLLLIKRKAQEKQLSISLNVLLNNPAKHLYLRHDFVIIGGNELEHAMRWLG
jgi:ribosomal protein S18 acetylase RimI-like enzyme